MSTYRDDLDALNTSAGFVWLKQFAKSQWGPTAYNARVAQLIAKADLDSSFDLKRELSILTKVQQEVNLILSWPENELKKIDAQTEAEQREPSMMRSGR